MKTATMSDLDKDALTNIFVRLPAKSLLRIKSVCKSWYDLINDYHFTKLHADQSYLHFILSDPDLHLTDFIKFKNPIKLPYPFNDTGDDFIRAAFYQYTRIVGICRGLFCFYMVKFPYTVILYNPTTRTHKILPSPPTIEDEESIYMGFGYDPVSDDYKFVKVFHYYQNNDHTSVFNIDNFKSMILIYSLKLDSWRTGIHDPPIFFSWDEQECIDINGTLHWSSSRGDYRMGGPIQTFNLWNQTFDIRKLPNISNAREDSITYRIGVLDDCLSLVVNYDYRGIESIDYYFDVWIWKNTIWVRLCKVLTMDNVRFRDLKCVYYFKSVNKLLVTYNQIEIGYLDIDSLQIRNFELPELNQIWVPYVCSENVLMLKDDDEALLENPEILRRMIKNRQTLLEITLRELRAHGMNQLGFVSVLARDDLQETASMEI